MFWATYCSPEESRLYAIKIGMRRSPPQKSLKIEQTNQKQREFAENPRSNTSIFGEFPLFSIWLLNFEGFWGGPPFEIALRGRLKLRRNATKFGILRGGRGGRGEGTSISWIGTKKTTAIDMRFSTWREGEQKKTRPIFLRPPFPPKS